MIRNIIIGDIHGCSLELSELLEKLQITKDDRIIFIGDAFSRGPDPLNVWKILNDIKCEMVLGNHEWGFYKAISPDMQPHKFNETKYNDIVYIYRKCFSIWDKLLEYIPNLPLYIVGQSYNGKNFLVIHAGVHPYEGLSGTNIDIGVAIRHFPRLQNADDPWWYDLYKGNGLIIFGHSAKKHIVRRKKNKIPIIMGIDTSCVYGGKLTAYIVEDDKIIQVDAKKQYYP